MVRTKGKSLLAKQEPVTSVSQSQTISKPVRKFVRTSGKSIKISKDGTSVISGRNHGSFSNTRFHDDMDELYDIGE